MKTKKTEYMATIFDGRSHIERRVYKDEKGFRYVKINGILFDVDFELKRFQVKVWYDG